MIVEVADAAARVVRGEVIAYPTETVYGLGADANSTRALAALRELKGRDADRGLSVLVSDVSVLDSKRVQLPESARRLIERYWPGPLTLVLPVPEGLWDEVATELGVGFRCSADATAKDLASSCATQLVSTSANRSGEPPCTTASQVEEIFGPDFPIAGGGPAGSAPPSTVVAVSPSGELTCLREGEIPLAELERWL